MKNNTLLYAGGAAVLGLLLLSKTSTTATTTTTGSLTTEGAPPPPATWSLAYYQQYQYPAMLKANPNVGNAAYTLTTAEAQQYIANYQDLQQWVALSSTVPKEFPTTIAAAQFHWHTFGPPEQRTFLPLIPQATGNYVPAPANSNSSGSGSTTSTLISTLGSLAIAFLGVNDPQPIMNDTEVAILINGSAIGLNILPLYYGAPDGLAMEIEDLNTALLKQYV